ncbi:MAG: 2-dehydropantoate 2-reductase [Burkholderiales bacterium]|nr:2-dehydropantoate 2-reductase [Burkholderiales bacterium]
MKRICIVGAGAIGGFLGTRLAITGQAEVSAVARGATLAALERDGWRAETATGALQAPARTVADPAVLGHQDLVIIAVKGPALPALAPRLAPLIGADTIVLPAMNGVPWWFCDDVAGFPPGPLASVDPGGAIARAIPVRHVVGCVVHVSCATSAPGVVRHVMGNGLIVGEARGGHSARARNLCDLLAHAGFDVTPSSDVRRDIWYKLWGNMTTNPVSALTGATSDRILDDPLVRELCSAAMREAAAIGARLGCPISETPEDRQAITARLGAFKTSMLQDVEAGRVLELDAIVGAVHEIGRRLAMPTPFTDALFGLARLFARGRGLYPDATHAPPPSPATR